MDIFLWLVHSGLLSFSAVIFILITGTLTWTLNKSITIAIINFLFVLLNLYAGIAQIVTHPGIYG